jgi:poly(ADP-ribose) glycohydrolase ARH3
MVGSAIGDALGAAFEGTWTIRKIEEINFRGRWTDDTHMTIGLAESLVANKGFDSEHMAQTFLRNWEKEPWRGYGPGPPRIFRMMKSGVPWNEAAKRLYGGLGSFGNGSAMRVAPIGLLYHDNVEKLREAAYRSAEVTHTHILGREGAAIQAYSVALALQTETGNLEPKEFLDKIAHFTKNKVYKEKIEKAKALLPVEDKSEVTRIIGNTVEAFNSVPTAIYCFARNHQNYVKAVSYAVSLGGDTDTIGAMTGAIAGAHQGEENLPKSWINKLEKADYITELAQKLWKMKNVRLRS